ncbi:MAG TPA: hypothetical protein VH040_06105 [Usitatibacter sp.]|jgi:hypothetical protein|nr:hypothetical protein [Usitatibacter sp.]
MNALRKILGKVATLFYDDASLAIAVLAILALAAAASTVPGLDLEPVMAFLVVGVVAALVENVVRAARAR